MPTAKHARKYPSCLVHWLTTGLPTSVPGPVLGTCLQGATVGWEAVAPPEYYSSVWKHSEVDSKGQEHALPRPGHRAWMSTKPSPDSPGPREASSGSFKDITKVVPPRKDWGGFNHRTEDPSLCTPSGPYRILSGPSGSGTGKERAVGRGDKANHLFCPPSARPPSGTSKPGGTHWLRKRMIRPKGSPATAPPNRHLNRITPLNKTLPLSGS